MGDRWKDWGDYLARVRASGGFDKPASVQWERRTGIDRNKWKRWEEGSGCDYDGLLAQAAFFGLPVEVLVARIEGRDYAVPDGRTWAEVAQALVDDPAALDDLAAALDCDDLVRLSSLLLEKYTDRLDRP
jgi:hypothetical protein